MTGERSRLTLTGHTREDRFGEVLLFRSRYLAPAAHSARFYREYFRPAAEHVVTKERRRWLVAYRGVEFYVHLDRLLEPPADGYFLEVKSRTWSQRDARDKAAIIAELLALFGATPDETIGDGYVGLAARRRDSLTRVRARAVDAGLSSRARFSSSGTDAYEAWAIVEEWLDGSSGRLR